MSKRFMVKITETYESFAVVEAKNPGDAEWLVEELVDSGDIDGVAMKGTLKTGKYYYGTSCQGPTAQPVTVIRKEGRKRNEKVHSRVARGQ